MPQKSPISNVEAELDTRIMACIFDEQDGTQWACSYMLLHFEHTDAEKDAIRLELHRRWLFREKQLFLSYDRSPIPERMSQRYSADILTEVVRRIEDIGFEDRCSFTLMSIQKREQRFAAGIAINISCLNGCFDVHGSIPGAIPWQGTVFATSDDEAAYIIRNLCERGHLEHVNRSSNSSNFLITPAGYTFLQAYRYGSTGTSNPFLVCRFIPKLDKTHEVLKEGVGKFRKEWVLKRVDTIVHSGRIDDRIHLSIRNAPLVIVDLTDCNFNVGYEAGYAIALGKPTIFVRSSVRAGKMPFDVQSLNVLHYKDLYDSANREEFLEKVVDRLEMLVHFRQ